MDPAAQVALAIYGVQPPLVPAYPFTVGEEYTSPDSWGIQDGAPSTTQVYLNPGTAPVTVTYTDLQGTISASVPPGYAAALENFGSLQITTLPAVLLGPPGTRPAAAFWIPLGGGNALLLPDMPPLPPASPAAPPALIAAAARTPRAGSLEDLLAVRGARLALAAQSSGGASGAAGGTAPPPPTSEEALRRGIAAAAWCYPWEGPAPAARASLRPWAALFAAEAARAHGVPYDAASAAGADAALNAIYAEVLQWPGAPAPAPAALPPAGAPPPGRPYAAGADPLAAALLARGGLLGGHLVPDSALPPALGAWAALSALGGNPHGAPPAERPPPLVPGCAALLAAATAAGVSVSNPAPGAAHFALRAAAEGYGDSPAAATANGWVEVGGTGDFAVHDLSPGGAEATYELPNPLPDTPTPFSGASVQPALGLYLGTAPLSLLPLGPYAYWDTAGNPGPPGGAPPLPIGGGELLRFGDCTLASDTVLVPAEFLGTLLLDGSPLWDGAARVSTLAVDRYPAAALGRHPAPPGTGYICAAPGQPPAPVPYSSAAPASPQCWYWHLPPLAAFSVGPGGVVDPSTVGAADPLVSQVAPIVGAPSFNGYAGGYLANLAAGGSWLVGALFAHGGALDLQVTSSTPGAPVTLSVSGPGGGTQTLELADGEIVRVDARQYPGYPALRLYTQADALNILPAAPALDLEFFAYCFWGALLGCHRHGGASRLYAPTAALAAPPAPGTPGAPPWSILGVSAPFGEYAAGDALLLDGAGAAHRLPGLLALPPAPVATGAPPVRGLAIAYTGASFREWYLSGHPLGASAADPPGTYALPAAPAYRLSPGPLPAPAPGDFYLAPGGHLQIAGPAGYRRYPPELLVLGILREGAAYAAAAVAAAPESAAGAARCRRAAGALLAALRAWGAYLRGPSDAGGAALGDAAALLLASGAPATPAEAAPPAAAGAENYRAAGSPPEPGDLQAYFVRGAKRLLARCAGGVEEALRALRTCSPPPPAPGLLAVLLQLYDAGSALGVRLLTSALPIAPGYGPGWNGAAYSAPPAAAGGDPYGTPNLLYLLRHSPALAATGALEGPFGSPPALPPAPPRWAAEIAAAAEVPLPDPALLPDASAGLYGALLFLAGALLAALRRELQGGMDRLPERWAQYLECAHLALGAWLGGLPPSPPRDRRAAAAAGAPGAELAARFGAGAGYLWARGERPVRGSFTFEGGALIALGESWAPAAAPGALAPPPPPPAPGLDGGPYAAYWAPSDEPPLPWRFRAPPADGEGAPLRCVGYWAPPADPAGSPPAEPLLQLPGDYYLDGALNLYAYPPGTPALPVLPLATGWGLFLRYLGAELPWCSALLRRARRAEAAHRAVSEFLAAGGTAAVPDLLGYLGPAPSTPPAPPAGGDFPNLPPYYVFSGGSYAGAPAEPWDTLEWEGAEWVHRRNVRAPGSLRLAVALYSPPSP